MNIKSSLNSKSYIVFNVIAEVSYYSRCYNHNSFLDKERKKIAENIPFISNGSIEKLIRVVNLDFYDFNLARTTFRI
jgi:hypothetical protein